MVDAKSELEKCEKTVRDFSITRYGLIADGKTGSTAEKACLEGIERYGLYAAAIRNMLGNEPLKCEYSGLAERLARFNSWRRGAEIEQPGPAQIGKDIDAAVKIISGLIKSKSR